ncbi:cellulose synthase subunit BcsC [Legionella busanensis]|uniref:Cellulose synthase subunit BcsC n=1 Tax=Legionella busanensis TaxID=190655 RepID=A0A378JJW1_9GAMM|nr:hypothetical protein [Legionella busanensis]STX50499.1 cellulose synthase subunit BcsC [Legionella busanensis]
MKRIFYTLALLIFVISVNGIVSTWAAEDNTIEQKYSLAQKLIAERRYQEAIKLLEEVKVNNKKPDVDITLGDTYVMLDNLQMALYYYKSALDKAKLSNNEVMARISLFRIARMQISLDQVQEAIINYELLLNMNLSSEDRGIAEEGLQKAQAILLGKKLQQAATFIEQGKGTVAFDLIKNDLEKNKDNYRLQIIAGQSLALMNKPQEALIHFQQALDLSISNDENNTALLNIIKMQYWLGDNQAAQKSLVELQKLPLSEQNKQQLNNIIEQSVATPKALEQKSAEEAQEVLLGDKLQKATVLIKREKGKAAYTIIKDELEKNISSYRLQFVAGQSLAMMGKPAEALDHFQRALALSQTNEQKIATLLNILKMQYWLKSNSAQQTLNQLQKLSLSTQDKQQLDKIITNSTIVLGLNTDDTKTEVNETLLGEKLQRAIVLIERGQGKAAYAIIKDELEKNDKSYRLQFVAGQSLAMMERPQEALRYFQRALSLSQNEEQRVSTLLNILKMQYWLKDNSAQQTLNQLQKLNLSAQERRQLDKIVSNSKAAPGTNPDKNEMNESLLGEKLQRAIAFIEQGRGKAAYAIIKDELEKNNKSYRLQFVAGQSLAIMEKPKEALNHFQLASELSENDEQKIATLLNILKMHYWLLNLKAAENTLKELHALPLTPKDKKEIIELTIKSRLKKASRVGKNPTDLAMERIRLALKKEKPREALALLLKYPNKTSYLYYLTAGDVLFLLEDPRNSEDYYIAAYKKATNQEERKAALFGIGKTTLWLEEYEKGLAAYRELSTFSLTKDDKEIVTTGLVISITNLDFPRKALTLVENTPSFNYPMSVIAATRAALYSGLAYKAQAIWLGNLKTLQKIPPGHFLQRQIREINWLLLQETSTAALGTNYYTVKDTDDFVITRQSADYSYRTFGINSNTISVVGQNFYTDPQYKIKMNYFSIRQIFTNIEDDLDLDFTATAAELRYGYPLDQSPWRPMLWRAGLFYHPNDYLVFNTYNSQEVVEAIPALQEGILINTTEGGFIFHPITRLYTRFAFFHNRFTDGNRRNGKSMAFSYQLIRQLALFVELRYRGYRNSLYSNGNYFSPAKLEEKTINVILKRRFTATWAIYAEGGVGDQTILPTPFDQESKAPVLSYDINLTGALTDNLRLNLVYGYSRNAFGSFMGSYARTYFAANLKLFIL